ncbi:radical SAM protein [Acidobacteriota bacterium]
MCSDENTLLWRKGGFYRARIGVESGSQRILDLMGKHINIAQVKTALTSLAAAGIKTTTYWIIKYPGETKEDFRETLDLLEELRDVIYKTNCNPFWYFLTGQPASEEWAQNRPMPLYSEKERESLLIQT